MKTVLTEKWLAMHLASIAITFGFATEPVYYGYDLHEDAIVVRLGDWTTRLPQIAPDVSVKDATELLTVHAFQHYLPYGY